jgi:alanyl-tRNA synthetase
LPGDPTLSFRGVVDLGKRLLTANNHTATHLIHNALRTVLGKHVEQKGSLVTPDKLRFDFSHFTKVTKEELSRIEQLANSMVRDNHICRITGGIPIEKAKSLGAIALFGEKYGDTVRVVEFGNSVELCGGTHVKSTGTIGIVKIVSEGAIAAGVRRIEAVTALKAEEYINEKLNEMEDIAALLKSTGSVSESVEKLLSENSLLKKSIEKYQAQASVAMIKELEEKAVIINNIRFVSGELQTGSAEVLKNIAYQLRNQSDNTVLVIGSENGDKANLLVMVSDKLVKENNISAVAIIKEIAGEINGGGGGQTYLATAGGKNPMGIQKAITKAATFLKKIL